MRRPPLHPQEVAAAVSQRHIHEVTNDDIESFRATLWRDQKEVLAQQAFGTAKKIIGQIDELLNAPADSLHARDIKDLSLAFSKVLGCVHGIHTRWAAGGGREQCADRPAAEDG